MELYGYTWEQVLDMPAAIQTRLLFLHAEIGKLGSNDMPKMPHGPASIPGSR